jgi:hypothetical protein
LGRPLLASHFLLDVDLLPASPQFLFRYSAYHDAFQLEPTFTDSFDTSFKKWLLYTGQWIAGRYSGHGQKREQNGNVFDGEFRAGKRCGLEQ